MNLSPSFNQKKRINSFVLQYYIDWLRKGTRIGYTDVDRLVPVTMCILKGNA